MMFHFQSAIAIERRQSELKVFRAFIQILKVDSLSWFGRESHISITRRRAERNEAECILRIQTNK